MRQRRNRSIGWLSALMALAVLLLSACGDDKPLAEYTLEKGGDKAVQVTEDEFDNYKAMKKMNDPYFEQRAALSPTFEEDLLKQYVAVKIYESKASKEEMDKLKKEIDEAYASIEKDENLKKQWGSMLEAAGISEDQYKHYMLLQNTAITEIGNSITEEQMKKKYDDTVAADPYAYYTTASYSGILISITEDRPEKEALKRAEEVKQKLESGTGFAEAAKQYSDDSSAKESGGVYKDANVNYLPTEVRKAVLEQLIGQISEPIKSASAYYIVRVDERVAPKYEDASVKEIVKGQMIEETFSNFIKNELGSYLKEINLPDNK